MPLQRFTGGEWLARRLDRHDLGGTAEQRDAVREICRRVALDGDAALREFSMRFDGWAPPPGQGLALDNHAMQQALMSLPGAERAALELAARRIRAFHEADRYDDVHGPENLELLVRPVGRAGLYVPGGPAPYPSTVLMTATPARVAGGRGGKPAAAPPPRGPRSALIPA